MTAIPESAFTGRPNMLLAAEIDVQVLGDAFTAAYTEGDNSIVVATDTMKNFIHRESLAFDGSTLEGWLSFLGRRFLETYPQMERLRVSAEEIRFDPARVPAADGGFERERRPVPSTPRRPWRGGARGRSSRRRVGRAGRPARRARRPGAAQDHRLGLRRLRARRVHDPARPQGPPALHPHGHRLALRRPGASRSSRTPARYVASRAGRATSRRSSSTSS